MTHRRFVRCITVLLPRVSPNGRVAWKCRSATAIEENGCRHALLVWWSNSLVSWKERMSCWIFAHGSTTDLIFQSRGKSSSMPSATIVPLAQSQMGVIPTSRSVRA